MSPSRRLFVRKIGVAGFGISIVDVLNPEKLLAGCNAPNQPDCACGELGSDDENCLAGNGNADNNCGLVDPDENCNVGDDADSYCDAGLSGDVDDPNSAEGDDSGEGGVKLMRIKSPANDTIQDASKVNLLAEHDDPAVTPADLMNCLWSVTGNNATLGNDLWVSVEEGSKLGSVVLSAETANAMFYVVNPVANTFEKLINFLNPFDDVTLVTTRQEAAKLMADEAIKHAGKLIDDQVGEGMSPEVASMIRDFVDASEWKLRDCLDKAMADAHVTKSIIGEHVDEITPVEGSETGSFSLGDWDFHCDPKLGVDADLRQMVANFSLESVEITGKVNFKWNYKENIELGVGVEGGWFPWNGEDSPETGYKVNGELSVQF